MNNIEIKYVDINLLKPADYNPRKWSKHQKEQLQQSIEKFGTVDPIIVNNYKDRENVVIGGHFRLEVCKDLGHKTVPVVYVSLPIDKEKELNLRLNKNQGEFDFELLKEFDDSLLVDVGFESFEIDKIFKKEETPESFDINKELAKLDIKEVKVKEGEIYDLDGSRLMVGDSTIEKDVLKLFGEYKADMCFTDPPYILDYLKGKKKRPGEVTKGFGHKRDRVYIGTETLPDNFTELWMNNVQKIQKDNFSIIVYENPKNLKHIWTELEKRWKYRNTLIWHIPNRVQGFSAKYKFFNKYDFAIVGTQGEIEKNIEPEDEPLFQEQYETAIFGTHGSPHWEGYKKGQAYCPTDHIEHIAADEKSSGQGIIFGTKPIEILIPYIKVLTRKNDLVFEPFGGSGSTLVASIKLGRRCFIMEKQPIYAEVIIKRWENLTGKKAIKLND